MSLILNLLILLFSNVLQVFSAAPFAAPIDIIYSIESINDLCDTGKPFKSPNNDDFCLLNAPLTISPIAKKDNILEFLQTVYIKDSDNGYYTYQEGSITYPERNSQNYIIPKNLLNLYNHGFGYMIAIQFQRVLTKTPGYDPNPSPQACKKLQYSLASLNNPTLLLLVEGVAKLAI